MKIKIKMQKEDLSQEMKTVKFMTEIGNDLYGVDDFLNLFDCYKRTQATFDVTLALKEDKNKGVHIHVREGDKTIEIADSSDLKNIRNEMTAQLGVVNPWEKIDGNKIHSYLKHTVEDFFLTKEKREQLISDEEWEELLKAQEI